MRWAALLLPAAERSPPDRALAGIASWALQFTPRVAVCEEAVVMEVHGSVSLFGGWRALRERVEQESRELDVGAVAWAPNSLAALAFARAGKAGSDAASLIDRLDKLPFDALSAAHPHRTTLAQIGCVTLGDVRGLPRAGIARRFDKTLLTALDQAYGLRPETHRWFALPETFQSHVELMARVELAPALLFGARRLLLQMSGWLTARHAGVTAMTLRWSYDDMRGRDVGPSDALTVRTASATRDVERLCRLLAEHLAKITLPAPVDALTLTADETQPLTETSASLLLDEGRDGEPFEVVLERVTARLGAERVLQPVLQADHRMEWMQRWAPAPQPPSRARRKEPPVDARLPQPAFVLDPPLRLACRGERPIYQGPLQLLTGPHRVEGGWWHRVAEDVDGKSRQRTHHVQRDYWVALSRHAGVLWIFQTRGAGDDAAWYLHGSFA